MVIFTASKHPDGNKLIPDEIIIDENSVTIKFPRSFGGKQISFPIGKMVVSIKRPIDNFCEIEFTTENGKSIRLHGFSEHEAKMIKNLINEKNINVANFRRKDYRSMEQKKKMQDNGEDMMQYGQFLHRVNQQREKILSVNKEQDTKVAISHGLKKEAAFLIRYYKDADFEIVDDDQEIYKNKKITEIFTRDCLTKAGRGRIRDSIEKIKDEENDNEYTYELELLLMLIGKIYDSVVYKELDAENKPRFPFGLDQQKIKVQLADKTVSQTIKMNRILHRVDSFIASIDNAF